jgi:hypothetical protein
MQDIIQIHRKGRSDKMQSRPTGAMNRKCVKKLFLGTTILLCDGIQFMS